MTKKTTPASPKTNLHAIFGTDSKLEEDGAWVDVNAFYGLRIKVRRMNSNAAVKAFQDVVIARYGEGKLRNPKNLDLNEATELQKIQLATAVLVDWEGLIDEGTGDEIPYSPEMAVTLMDIKDFREFVYQAATERDSFREQADEEAEKN